MKLAAKLILLFMLGVLGIVALFSWQTIRRQLKWDEELRANHVDDVVGALKPAIDDAYRNGGVVTIQQAIEVTARHIPGQELRWVEGVPAGDSETKITSRKVSRISVSDKDGETVAHTFVPLEIDGSQAGGVEVSQSMEQQEQFIRDSMIASLLSLLGVAALSGMMIYFGGVRLVGKPLEKLIDQVHQIGAGKLPQPPALKRSDELGSLAQAISLMSRQLDQQQNTIRHTDRLGTVGTLAAGMAHEMGTPLNVVAGRAGLIASGKLSPEEVRQSAQTIKSEAERMTTLIRQLLDFARQSPTTHTRIDIGQIARTTCDLIEPIADKSSVKIDLRGGDQAYPIRGDATQIQQVLTNFLTNAVQAMPDGGTVTVALERRQSSRGDRMVVHVTDHGRGIPREQLDHVFEPFYTTKDIGQGTGLGLSIAYGIVREHGGDIEVQSEENVQTTFTVSLPAADETTTAAEEPTAAAPS
ncbi:HAMP domain-containing histidine kinase [Stieleria sp. ICT_E10.1]|uniref:sensor histidine kinase n=1 Tax=Stieleria sedimenti TaxID=2976331 RepID=UPI00218084BD|nr:HAMP domain-containing sensor histidine kinase [Stieleria sedimenti]MCS7471142.1 HAMP domain-containing histidine kinase [Stieleria sedimenti]